MRLAIMALALTGCSANDEPGQADTSVPARERAELAAGEARLVASGVVLAPIGGVARLKGRDIRPLAIVENSLCPAFRPGTSVDIACDSPGRLRLRVSISGVPGEPVLELDQAFALSDGGEVMLVAIVPPLPGPNRTGPRFGFR